MLRNRCVLKWLRHGGAKPGEMRCIFPVTLDRFSHNFLSIFHQFLIDFDSFLRGVPTPGPPGAPQGWQRGLQVFFSLIFRGPRGGLGAPFGPWGAPRAPKWRPSRAKKWEKDRSRRPSRSQADFGGEQGGARTLRMWLNHSKY